MAYRQMKEREELMANSEWPEGAFLILPSAISHKLFDPATTINHELSNVWISRPPSLELGFQAAS